MPKDKDPKKYLYDISESIEFIFDDHLQEIDSLSEYEEDRTIQDAVERRLTIIGEAIHMLRKQGISLPSGDQIVNRRNTITHQYDEFGAEAIWKSVHSELPSLKEEVDRLLEE